MLCCHRRASSNCLPSKDQRDDDAAKAEVRNLLEAYGWRDVLDLGDISAARDTEGEVLAAIHIHGPAYRFPDPDRAHDLGLSVIEASDALAEQFAIA